MSYNGPTCEKVLFIVGLTFYLKINFRTIQLCKVQKLAFIYVGFDCVLIDVFLFYRCHTF